MAMKVYEVSSNIEWDSPPAAFYTDVDFYLEKATVVAEKLKEMDMNYALAWWYGEPEGSEFLVEDDENDEDDLIDGQYRVATDNDFEAHWQGPHLKIYSDGTIQLKWESKHTNDECWCDLK
jgi:hypothetical protein